ncbi:hypothetical protein Riv7116_0959 [Rivularia sp. PCC 7116]|uniref:hypothetical protein n=1 Tax=Rivularia sp. PCC 7116 TaxID=373994 RepID=UPI00029F4A10|nr:hypothetical protein [Rivularia sp. PCC 7116]AFY53534.1 hypothetical protein Riv7116_0959 [Rivularia sp. PCC 7116]
MGRRLTITIASIFALAIAGCSGEEEQVETVAPAPNETAENNQGKTENFKDPVVPATQSPTVAKAPSTLIQPTNPTERVGVVSKGRSDPFEGIIAPVKFATKKPEGSTINKPKKAVPVLPPLPSSSRRIASRRRPRSAVISATTGGSSRNTVRNSSSGRAIPKKPPTIVKKPNSNLNPGRAASVPVVPKVLPGVIPQPDLASVLPPPPQPKLAQAVLVSGVIQVGNRPQAIIKVPSEPTSRYVQAGQRLASGLLVKRIEMNEGSEPVVVLEQYGIEVARMVGEAAMGASEPATASTENSVSTLPPLPKSTSIGAS